MPPRLFIKELKMDNEYKNVFCKAKSAYGTGAYDDATIEFLFPQLAKSEDDKVYDELVHVVNTHCMDEDRECLLEYLKKWKEIQRFKSPSAQPQPEWSEEDEKMLDSALWHIKNSCGNGGKTSGEYEVYHWLKNIPNRFSIQPIVEWSEEDEKNLKCTISFLQTWYPINEQYGAPRKALNKCLSWLEHRFKFLRPQKKEDLPKWKPSKEQMKALESCFCEFGEGYPDEDGLRSLYNDLKKLMEDEK